MVRTIDVSRWQGSINWHAVKSDGVAGAWIKVGGADGGYYPDSRGQANLAGAAAAGLPFGTYYFASPQRGQGRAQAQHAVSCGHGKGQLWPALDLETHNGLSGRELDQFALDFNDEVQRLTGRPSIIYTGAWIGNASTGFFGADARLARYPLWIANYGNNSPGAHPPSDGARIPVPAAWSAVRWSMWQFNSTTRVPGITANTVDQNTAKDSFWAQQMGATGGEVVYPDPEISKELDMKAVGIQGEPALSVLVTDGNGRRLKEWIPNQEALGVLKEAGVVDGEVWLTDPGQIAWFRSLPQVKSMPADDGALTLTVKIIETINAAANRVVETVLAQPGSTGGGEAGGTVDPQVLADAIANELAERLKDDAVPQGQ